jgi:AcrR family transcriptional regulator
VKSEFHETKERLIQTTVELIDEMSLESISSALILERSGVSKGSMYHFFDDLGDLLDAAYARRFSYLVKISADYLRQIVETANDAEEFFALLRKLTIRTQERGKSSTRFERARMLARAEGNERFRKILGDIQQELTDTMAESVRMAQEKGWVTKKYQPRTISVFIQSYTLGRVVDEIVENHMNDEDWNNLIHAIAETVFGNLKSATE